MTQKTQKPKYTPLPDNAARNRIGRKTRSKRYDKAVLVNMTTLDLSRLKISARRAGFPSYASYVRFLSDKVINEETLVVQLPRTLMANLKANAEASGKSIEEYTKFLAGLKVEVS